MVRSSHKSREQALKLGLALNIGYTIFEFATGLFTGSLALFSDAAHNLTDSLSIFVAFIGARIGRRGADERHTFGHSRANVLAALINAAILIGLSLFIFYESYSRLAHPRTIQGGIVAVVAFVGILVNGVVAWRFARDKDDINIRSAYLNMALDTLASVGAVIAGIVMAVTGSPIADSIIAVIIGVMLVVSGASVLKQVFEILLEGVPSHINPVKVREALEAPEFVRGIEDLHIWTLASNQHSLSCHVIVDPTASLEQCTEWVEQIKIMLRNKFDIEHVTIELRTEPGPLKGEHLHKGA